MTEEDKKKLMDEWIKGSSDDMFRVFSAWANKVFDAEPDTRAQMKCGVRMLTTFVLMSLMLLMIEERNRKNSSVFEEKAVEVKRFFIDDLNDMCNKYFNKPDYIMSTKIGEA